MTFSKPSVLLIGNFLSGSTPGHQAVSEDLADHLQAAGWEVVTASDKPERLLRLYDMLQTAWRQRRRYAAANVEVYSGLAFVWAEVVCALLRRLGKPYVLTLHGGNLPNFAGQNAARVRHLLASARAVTTPSHYLLENLRPYHDDIRLIPNPIDVSVYPFVERVQPAPRLMWLRAFHKIYNPNLALQVLAALDMPDAHLWMVGRDKDDGALQEFQAAAASLGVADQITLPGGVPKADVPAWLNRGDIFLNTTNVDNTPISVLEAMACGLCIVSTNVGGIPYLLEHEHDALLVPPGDSQAMANCVRRLLAEPELARRLSANARAKVQQFDWSAVLPQWTTLMCAVAQGV